MRSERDRAGIVKATPLRPFFCFFGGKWRVAPHYPAPEHARIVEPFAGAAGYATRYHDRAVTLIEIDPVIAGLWRYLTKVTESEILSLPIVVESVPALAVCAEAKSLIGFWVNKGSSSPCNVPSAWMRGGMRPKSYWGEEIRARIASQVGKIRHWRIIEGSYADLPESENSSSTWFVDPPYQVQGRHYRFSSVDYPHLAAWSRARVGNVIACEQAGASWLPFEPFRSIKSNNATRTSAEVVCYLRSAA